MFIKKYIVGQMGENIEKGTTWFCTTQNWKESPFNRQAKDGKRAL